jgi:imidazolonepropionase-like amidohydrolase
MERPEEEHRVLTMTNRHLLTALGTITACFLVFVMTAAEPAQPIPAASAPLAIRGGTLIDPRNGNLLPNTTIVTVGERIVSVGGPSTAIPEGARVIDATGKFVMPGLWDSHAHTRDLDGTLYINHGVTSTMDMGNILDWIMVMSEAREKAKSFGPRIFPQGMVIAGRLGPHEWNVEDTDQARWAARTNIEAGSTFLKVYQEATPDIVKAVAEEGAKVGLNLHGHIRKSDAREAILAGIAALAHGSGIAAATSPPDVAARIKSGEMSREIGSSAVSANYLQDTSTFDSLVKLMVDHHTLMEPNIVYLFKGVYDQFDRYQLENHRLSVNANATWIPEMFTRMWATDYAFRTEYPAPPPLMKKLKQGYANHRLFVKKFAAAGGHFLVGTDAWYQMVPGLSVWQEMELMVDAGVSPLSTLQGATINPAAFVHKDKDLGTVEVGKLADIIILNKNPLIDISNIRSLATVIQHGKVQELGYRTDYRNPIPRPYQVVNGELPRPYITSVEPSGIARDTPGAVLTIKGRDFNKEHRVLWDDVDLRVLSATPTEVTVSVPAELLRTVGTRKIQMITGGRVHQPSKNFAEVMVTFGRTFKQRWNGQNLSIVF